MILALGDEPLFGKNGGVGADSLGEGDHFAVAAVRLYGIQLHFVKRFFVYVPEE
jgi:hypothetical protein